MRTIAASQQVVESTAGQMPAVTQLNPENRIIVRIWEMDLRHGCVGHGSVEANNTYMSLWPKKRSVGVVLGRNVEADFHTYQQDITAEKKDPTLTICFYSLDIPPILEAFIAIQNEPDNRLQYVLYSGINRGDQVANCFRFVADRLREGGMTQKLEPRLGFSQASSAASVLTPDLFIAYVKDAKKKELRDYPETAGFDKDFSQDNNIVLWAPTVGRSCCVIL